MITGAAILLIGVIVGYSMGVARFVKDDDTPH